MLLSEYVKKTESGERHGVTAKSSADELEAAERYFWRNVTFNPPLYGADSPGSFFDDSAGEWNFAALPKCLLRSRIHTEIPGITTPFLYVGSFRSCFSLHRCASVRSFARNYG